MRRFCRIVFDIPGVASNTAQSTRKFNLIKRYSTKGNSDKSTVPEANKNDSEDKSRTSETATTKNNNSSDLAKQDTQKQYITELLKKTSEQIPLGSEMQGAVVQGLIDLQNRYPHLNITSDNLPNTSRVTDAVRPLLNTFKGNEKISDTDTLVEEDIENVKIREDEIKLYKHFTDKGTEIPVRTLESEGFTSLIIRSPEEEERWVNTKHPSVEILEYAMENGNYLKNCRCDALTNGLGGLVNDEDFETIERENQFETIAEGYIDPQNPDIPKLVGKSGQELQYLFVYQEKKGAKSDHVTGIHKINEDGTFTLAGTWAIELGVYKHEPHKFPEAEWGSYYRILYTKREGGRLLKRDENPTTFVPNDYEND